MYFLSLWARSGREAGDRLQFSVSETLKQSACGAPNRNRVLQISRRSQSRECDSCSIVKAVMLVRRARVVDAAGGTDAAPKSVLRPRSR